jgi:hypothetical protein
LQLLTNAGDYEETNVSADTTLVAGTRQSLEMPFVANLQVIKHVHFRKAIWNESHK